MTFSISKTSEKSNDLAQRQNSQECSSFLLGFLTDFTGYQEVDYINLWPLGGKIENLTLVSDFNLYSTIAIVNAINITDGLDGLAGGLMIDYPNLTWTRNLSQWNLYRNNCCGDFSCGTWSFSLLQHQPSKGFYGRQWSLLLQEEFSLLSFIFST